MCYTLDNYMYFAQIYNLAFYFKILQLFCNSLLIL